jgi:hypothetical protein
MVKSTLTATLSADASTHGKIAINKITLMSNPRITLPFVFAIQLRHPTRCSPHPATPILRLICCNIVTESPLLQAALLPDVPRNLPEANITFMHYVIV